MIESAIRSSKGFIVSNISELNNFFSVVNSKEIGDARKRESLKEERLVLSRTHVRIDTPVVIVVHKAVRRERIRPYRRSVPVSRETSSRARHQQVQGEHSRYAHLPVAW